MSGMISEFFGYPAAVCSTEAMQAAASMTCSILGMPCAKHQLMGRRNTEQFQFHCIRL